MDELIFNNNNILTVLLMDEDDDEANFSYLTSKKKNQPTIYLKIVKVKDVLKY